MSVARGGYFLLIIRFFCYRHLASGAMVQLVALIVLLFCPVGVDAGMDVVCPAEQNISLF